MSPLNLRLNLPEDLVQNFVSSICSLLHIHGRAPSIISAVTISATRYKKKQEQHRPQPQQSPRHRTSSTLTLSAFPAAIKAILSADIASR